MCSCSTAFQWKREHGHADAIQHATNAANHGRHEQTDAQWTDNGGDDTGQWANPATYVQHELRWTMQGLSRTQ